MSETAEELSKLLRVLANPVRLEILALCLEERTLKELREKLGISKPLLIAHIKKLVNHGFLACKTEFCGRKPVKYYKTRSFEVCCGVEMLKDILEEIE